MWRHPLRLFLALYQESLLGSQRPCSAWSNVYAIQVFLQVLVNFTLRWVCFILLFSLRVVLVTFTILKQYGSKIERLLCKSKIARLLCKRQQIRLTLKCKGTLKGRETCFFYKSKIQSRRSHLRLEKINESRMRIWDRRNKHIIWLFRPNPPLPTHQGARWRRSSMTGGAALSFCRHRGSATSQRRRQLSGDLDLGLRTSGPAALLTLSATVRGGF